MDWHARDADEVAQTTRTHRHRGLTHVEAEARLARDGPNALPEGKKRGVLRRLLAQFNSPLIYILLVAGTVTFVLADYLDTWVIAGVVVINAAIGFVQEGRAEQALEAVRGLLAETAVVIRDGISTRIPATQLVVGDLIEVQSGSRVPADARVCEQRNLTVSESALTGESQPTSKVSTPVEADSALAERHSMVFAGTLVATGTARAVVVATGSDSELGRIGAMVQDIGVVHTPLSKRLDRFARQITLAILAVGAAVFAYGALILNSPTTELFIAVVGLAVAAIPEGLPAVVTIVLALSTRLMASNGALIRRLPAVESLGSVSIIWSDKTGTLTQNEMTVASIVTATGEYDVTGVGYRPEGEVLRLGAAISPEVDLLLEELGRAGMLCNRADVRQDSSGEFVAVGDPTEAALITLGRKLGLSHEALHASYPLLDHIPFESHRRFMATLHDCPGESGSVVYAKGAPERILELAQWEWDGFPLDLARWQAEADGLARRGQRVLALAGLPAQDGADLDLEAEGTFTHLRFLGLVGVIDPPREAAKEAIAACQQAGIAVKMITGDHLVTASVIGAALGLNADHPLSGQEIDHLDDTELVARIGQTDVVARANPEHKLRLVRLVQAQGFQAAMTGDGVNDAPALQAADIGVAMGKNGTDAARSASDLVLTDDRFETIERAVERGRVVFDNIKKSLLFILPTNLGEASIVLIALLAGWTMPITASQILWVNMVTAVTLSLVLVVERGEAGLMQRPPRPADEPLVTLRVLLRIALVGTLLVAATLGVFQWQVAVGVSVEEARTAAVTMLVVAEVWYLFSSRRFTQSGLTLETFLGNRMALVAIGVLLVAQSAFTYLPGMNELFGTSPLPAATWFVTVALGAGVFAVVEAEKWLWRRRGVTAF
jgi:magnesium-transporting ATPase (P-type)